MKANYIPAALVIVTLFTCQASAGDLGGATAAGRVAGQETGAAQNAADAARRTMPPPIRVRRLHPTPTVPQE